MERKNGESPLNDNDVEHDLLSRGRQYSFYQALRLLKVLSRKNGRNPLERIRVRPNLSLSFPASDIEKVEKIGNGSYSIIANILGLYGTGSPLPSFYTEDLIDNDQNGERAVKDLLDLVNHQVYHLLYSSWTRYRSMATLFENEDPAGVPRFFSLTGLDFDTLSREFHDPLRLLRYSGILGMRIRSAAGLETILSDYFGNIPVRVIQMEERRGGLAQDQMCCLGKNFRLGVNSSLGFKQSTRNGAFRIEIGPLSRDRYQQFVPGRPDYEALNRLVRLYVAQTLEYTLDVIMDKNEKPQTLCLGGDRPSRLGMDSWVFSDDGPAEFRSRFYPGKTAA